MGQKIKRYESENTVYDAKRLIGRKFEDPVVQSEINMFPFNVVNENNNIYIKVNYKNEEKNLNQKKYLQWFLQK